MARQTDYSIAHILAHIECSLVPDWKLYYSPASKVSSAYLQIKCVINGYAVWSARKWMLSYHMCDTEIVNTAYLAYQQAMQHELGEMFTFNGVAVYDPHRSVLDPTKQDTRADSINAA